MSATTRPKAATTAKLPSATMTAAAMGSAIIVGIASASLDTMGLTVVFPSSVFLQLLIACDAY